MLTDGPSFLDLSRGRTKQTADSEKKKKNAETQSTAEGK